METDVLTITFCRDSNGEAGIAVFKELKDGKSCAIKMEMGEQAYDLYYLLTNQSAKVEEIKVNKSEAGIKLMHIKDMNISKSMQDSIKDSIQKANHTCGRCRYEQLPEDVYPCNSCVQGVNDWQDLWEEKRR